MSTSQNQWNLDKLLRQKKQTAKDEEEHKKD